MVLSHCLKRKLSYWVFVWRCPDRHLQNKRLVLRWSVERKLRMLYTVAMVDDGALREVLITVIREMNGAWKMVGGGAGGRCILLTMLASPAM